MKPTKMQRDGICYMNNTLRALAPTTQTVLTVGSLELPPTASDRVYSTKIVVKYQVPNSEFKCKRRRKSTRRFSLLFSDHGRSSLSCLLVNLG